MPILVVYAFHEDNECVRTFLQRGVFQDTNVQFVLVCNNPTLTIPVPPYVTYITRENSGHDFGAWSYGLLTADRYKSYDTFICVNSTCMGPFLPRWCTTKWVHVFANELTESVQLVGSTINCIDNPRTSAHVQSYAFAMTRPALDLLIEKEIFSLTSKFHTKLDAVEFGEIRMSREILARGWNICALMYYPRTIDWSFQTKRPEEYSIKFLGDLMFPHVFFGETAHPYESMFVKANRRQCLEWLRTYTHL